MLFDVIGDSAPDTGVPTLDGVTSPNFLAKPLPFHESGVAIDGVYPVWIVFAVPGDNIGQLLADPNGLLGIGRLISGLT